MPRCLPILNSFFDRFLIDFCSQLGPPEPKKSSPHCRESTIFRKIAFRNWHRFLIDLGANMASFWFPKTCPILQKIDPKTHQFFDRFWYRFLDGPRGPQDRPRRRSKRQDGPKRPPRATKSSHANLHFSILAAKSFQSPLKTAPRAICGWFFCQFCNRF